MKWLLRQNDFYVDKEKTKLICEIGLSKLIRFQDKDTYVCACSTIDNDSSKNDYTLIIFNDKHSLEDIDFPVEKKLTISQIQEIKPSEHAIAIDDLINIYNRTEMRMGLYSSAIVSLQVSKKILSVNPRRFHEHFLYDTRPYKTRLVFADMNNQLRKYAIDFEKKFE
jgi:hypothetical protein